MKFAHFAAPFNKPGMTALERYQQLWRELRLCDELGFDFGFIAEQHCDQLMISTAVYCTAGAECTRRMRLGPMGYVFGMHSPMSIVEEVAILDNVLDGRMEIGIVTGNMPEHFEIFGGDWLSRSTTTREGIALLKSAFVTDGSFNFEGPVHRYQDIELHLKPVQKPSPPMWWTSRQPDSLEFMAKEGVHAAYGIFQPRLDMAPVMAGYRRSWRRAGHSQTPNIGYLSQVYVDETDELAVAKAAPHLRHTYDFVYRWRVTGLVP